MALPHRLTLKEKEQAVVAAYNKASGRKLKVLPKQKRISEAISVFDVEDYANTFEWAKYDPWCKQHNILMTRPAWLCSYDVVAEHSDFEPPKEEESWQ